MFGSSILEVAIGVAFIYLLLSLVCSVINEGIASIINKRGKTLFEGIKNLLNDPKFTGLAQKLYTHGLVDCISQEATNPDKANRLPSYMSSNTFALALLDILGSGGAGESWKNVVNQRKSELDAAKANLDAHPSDTGLQKVFHDAEAAFEKAQKILPTAAVANQAWAEADSAAQLVTDPEDFKKLQIASAKFEKALAIGRALAAEFPDPLGNIEKAVENLPPGHTKEALGVLVDKTKRETALVANQIEKLQENIEHWFNAAMDRVSGWYKRWTQKILLAIAIILVLAVNADTLMLAKRFTRDNALRASVVTVVEKAVQNDAGNPGENARARQDLLEEAGKLTLPLGWIPTENDSYKTDQIPDSFLGWLLKFVGLLISVFAVSLGAPFWFDTLSKFINLRAAGTPPGETTKSAPQPAKS